MNVDGNMLDFTRHHFVINYLQWADDPVLNNYYDLIMKHRLIIIFFQSIERANCCLTRVLSLPVIT